MNYGFTRMCLSSSNVGGGRYDEAERKKSGGGGVGTGVGDDQEIFVCRRALTLKPSGKKKKSSSGSGASFTPVVLDGERGFIVPDPNPKHKGRKGSTR